jgi:hypothetical protein
VAHRSEDKNRVLPLNECLGLIDEVLALVPTRQEMPPSVRHRAGYYFVESRHKVSRDYDETGNVTSQRHVLTSNTLPLNGVRIDWKLIMKLRSRLAIKLGRCGIEYPDQCNIKEERHGDRTLVHEVAWRLCMHSLREELESLIEVEEGAAAQTDVASQVLSGRSVRWSDDDRDAIRNILSGQKLKLFNVLWAEDRPTYYGTLKNNRADKLWRGQPDPDSINDDTVFEALRKLQKAMPSDWPYSVRIEHESKRAKIIPPEKPNP